jgi:nitrogen fixation NifU-like protein
MEHFNAPRNSGALEQPDRVGRAGTPGQGPFMILYLKLDDGRVARAGYQTFGCGASIAAGSLLTETIVGREIRECLALTSEQLSDAMGGFPPDKAHCPILAVAALRDALKGVASA